MSVCRAAGFHNCLLLGCNLMGRPGGPQLFCGWWDNGCDVGLYCGVQQSDLEPAPLVVVLGLWAVLWNLARQNLFMQVSIGLFTPRLCGASHQPAWLCLHLFTEGKQNFALTHLLQRNSHCLSLDRLSSEDITRHRSFSLFSSPFFFSQI